MVTARDFLFAWRRTLAPETAAGFGASYLYYIERAREINSGKAPPEALGAAAPDDFSLEIVQLLCAHQNRARRKRNEPALFEGAGDKRSHAGPVEARKFRGKRVECLGFHEQSLAPALERALPGRVDVVTLRPQIESRANRRRTAVVASLNHRWIVIAATLVLFGFSVYGATRLQQQF